MNLPWENGEKSVRTAGVRPVRTTRKAEMNLGGRVVLLTSSPSSFMCVALWKGFAPPSH